MDCMQLYGVKETERSLVGVGGLEGLAVLGLEGGGLLLLGGRSLGEEDLVICLLLLLCLGAADLECAQVTAALQTERGDETLNLRAGDWVNKNERGCRKGKTDALV